MPKRDVTDAPDLDRIREDHAREFAAIETRIVDKYQHLYGTVSLRQGVRHATREVLEWVLATQRAMDRLDTADMVAELRKGAGSLYYPLFEHDPAIWLECPRCDMRTLHTADGCSDCGHDYQ